MPIAGNTNGIVKEGLLESDAISAWRAFQAKGLMPPACRWLSAMLVTVVLVSAGLLA